MNTVPVKNNDPYAFSKRLYILKCALDYFITIITGGAYLAKLTTTIGISDGLTAILTNLTSLAGIFQLVSIRLAQRPTLKSSVVPLKTSYHLIYSLIYLIPFFGWGTNVNSVLFFICVFLACVMNQICSPLQYSWFMALPTPEERGPFTSTVNIASHISGLIFSLTASLLLDYFTETNNLNGMFITFTSVIFVLAVLHLITTLLAKEKPRKIHQKSSVSDDFKILIRNRRFRLIAIVYILHCMAVYATNSFIGTYQVRELGFSMIRIYILSAVTAVSAVLFLSVSGNFARKKGLTRSLFTGIPIYALSYLFIVFSGPSNGFVMLILFNTVSTLGSAFLTVGIDTIIFEIVDEEYRASAISVRNIPAGLFAFLTTLALTPLLNYIQNNGNTLFGIHLYAQQLFALISGLIMLIEFTVFASFARIHKNK